MREKRERERERGRGRGRDCPHAKGKRHCLSRSSALSLTHTRVHAQALSLSRALSLPPSLPLSRTLSVYNHFCLQPLPSPQFPSYLPEVSTLRSAMTTVRAPVSVHSGCVALARRQSSCTRTINPSVAPLPSRIGRKVNTEEEVRCSRQWRAPGPLHSQMYVGVWREQPQVLSTTPYVCGHMARYTSTWGRGEPRPIEVVGERRVPMDMVDQRPATGRATTRSHGHTRIL